ncbi:MAG: hypothetical protein CBC12_03025 [Candidatus Puniceispirillum sp. TMED52]|nr:hypothetical protein [SAR116 cluster bacterium]OUU53036.1 MAG: hypothetical protein CBC12_03025 [Candidatus Puniceispirillum sp. TMED52]HCP17729.1 hypothetical protein [Alphaproteobacteria bacterium]
MRFDLAGKHGLACLMAFMLMLMPISVLADQHDSLIMPDPSLQPEDVVTIQMMALQNNDNISDDLGLRQTWVFAHPDNKAVTGPYDRFAMMLRNPTYLPMINHRNFEIIDQRQEPGEVKFLIEMETPENLLYRFVWVVKKVEDGDEIGSWMTSAVSAPMQAGEGS